MARYKGHDYDADESVERTKTEWYKWIKHAVDHGCFVRGEAGETFVHRRSRHPVLVAEIYATPSQLGVSHLINRS